MAEDGKQVKPEVITRDIDSSDAAVTEIRKETPLNAPGESTPIDRIPLRQNLVMMANAGVTTAKIASTDRCIRVITVPTKGGGTLQCHCSKACVTVGTGKYCPDHDTEAFRPNQTPHGTSPRTFNSASIPLSKSELKDCGLESDPTQAPAVQAATPKRVTQDILEKDVAEPRHDVKLYFTLDELSGPDLLKVFVDRATEALDGLPCANLKQMKQMSAIQAKIAKIANKPRRKRNDTPGTEGLRGTEG